MKKICVIFGGNSPEHDVSIITGLQLCKALEQRQKIEKIYLGLDNKFYLATQISEPNYFADKNNIRLKQVYFCDGLFYKSKFNKKICDVDCVINCCHGGVGENGNLAGFFDTLGIRYVGSNCESGSLTMDKTKTKTIVAQLANVVKGVEINKDNFDSLDKLLKDFDDDLIVKPNGLGSSIGVKVCNKVDVSEQIKAIFEMNDTALVENRIVEMIELNQACYQKKEKLVLSAIEKPLSRSTFLTFEEKYSHNSKIKGKDRELPAKIKKSLIDQINRTTQAIYKLLGVNGVVRIDYIYDTKNEMLYFNEINTIPGSMAFYLYEAIGVDYLTLIEDLINNATMSKKYTYFDTQILKDKTL